MSQIFPVTLTIAGETKRYTKEFQTAVEFAAPWKRVLARAHGNAYFSCCCDGRGEKRLAVRNYEGADSFGLARFPFTGAEHSKDCRFYAPDPGTSGLKSYEKGVVEQRPDGTLKVVLGVGLVRKGSTSADTAPAAPPRPGSVGSSQRTMRLRGLLHLLWSEAEINVWHPRMDGKRDMGKVHWYLNVAAENIVVGKTRLNDALLVMARNPAGGDAARNSSRYAQAVKRNRRLVVIAPLAAHTPEREAEMWRLPISGFHGMPRLRLPKGSWEICGKSFPREVAAWRAGGQVIAIAEIEPQTTKDGGLPLASVLQLALMQVNAQWIPVESSYELRIADMLVDEGRVFSKPLRFDATAETVFPDFILTDTETPAPLEVFGRTDEAYEVRKQEKVAYYTAQYGVSGWWCWNAATDPEGRCIPPFPPAGRA